MPTPEYIKELRRDIGTKQLYLPGVTAVVVRRHAAGAPLRTPEVLLVKRSDNALWSATSGILEPGESPAAAAAREVLEETGIECRPLRVAAVSDGGPVTFPNGDKCWFHDVTFEMGYVSGEPFAADDESTEAAWFAADAFPEPFVQAHRQRIAWALDEGAPARFPLHPQG